MSTRDQIIDNYEKQLISLLRGDYDNFSKYLRGQREQELSSFEKESLALLKARLEIKSKGPFIQEINFEPEAFEDELWKAEAHYIKGLQCFYQGEYSSSEQYFFKASEKYELLNKIEKKLLSDFNFVMSRANARSITSSPQIVLMELSRIEVEAEVNGLTKILGMVRRQKSYIYFEEEKFNAALVDAKKALKALVTTNNQSDIELLHLHMADTYIELKDQQMARAHIEFLIEPIDSRLEFARDYLLVKLNEKKSLSLSDYSCVSTHWKERFEKYILSEENDTDSIWDIDNKILKIENIDYSLRPNSKEGELISILIKNKASKDYLIEVLWSDWASIDQVDNRFFKLVGRINKKFNSLISFDGAFYCLTKKISKGSFK